MATYARFKAIAVILGIAACFLAQAKDLKSSGYLVHYSTIENHYASINTASVATANENTNDSESESAPAGDSYAVEIIQPNDTIVPSLAFDLNNSLMSNELVNQLENDYKQLYRDYSMTYGYYYSRRDSRGFRPYGLSAQQDEELRTNMARQSAKYMALKGIPNFLKSRPATRNVGRVYDDAIYAANRAATVEIKSKSGWKYNAGFNPFEFKLFAKATTEIWRIELTNEIQQKQSPLSHENPLKIMLGKRVGTYGFEAKYDYWTQFEELSMSHDF